MSNLSGSLICAMRNEYGLSMHELGSVIGVHQSTVSRWEKSETIHCDPRHRALLLNFMSHPKEKRKEYGQEIQNTLCTQGNIAALQKLLLFGNN